MQANGNLFKWLVRGLGVALVGILIIGMIIGMVDAANVTREEYYEAKASLGCIPGETLKCLKEGVKVAVEETTGNKVEDLYFGVFRPSGGPSYVGAHVLFEDDTYKDYNVKMDVYGVGNDQLYYSIDGIRNEDDPDYWYDGTYIGPYHHGHPDKIMVTREWIINTESYGAWGSPENIPDDKDWTCDFGAECFFATVDFQVTGGKIDIRPATEVE